MGDLDTIYKQYGKAVYYFLLSLSHDENLSEELTQETMFRAVMNIDSFRGESKMSVWLFQIAKNLYFEWIKKNKRIKTLDENEEKSVFSVCDIEENFEDKDTANKILCCLHGLKEPYKEVFTLHALGNVPLNQISQLFGKSESWARVTYYRAKAMISEKMGEGV